MAIYTGRGDYGKTSLFGSKRLVSKESFCVEALGSVDELNAQLGVVVGLCGSRSKVREVIISIQQDLFEIASELAAPRRKAPFYCHPGKTRRLEELIDEIEGRLPVLANFIFPGGSRLGATVHLARSVARRVERAVVGLSRKEKINLEILRYLNRLSDALFMIARWANNLDNVEEEIWKRRK